jgi:hypothetical protein
MMKDREQQKHMNFQKKWQNDNKRFNMGVKKAC